MCVYVYICISVRTTHNKYREKRNELLTIIYKKEEKKIEIKYIQNNKKYGLKTQKETRCHLMRAIIRRY